MTLIRYAMAVYGYVNKKQRKGKEKMKREFTPKQLKELREVNPLLTDGLFSEIIKDLSEDYSFYTFNEGYPDTYAFNLVKWAMEDIKVVNASALLIEAGNYPLVKESEAKYRDFRRYYIFNAETLDKLEADASTYDNNDCLNELASLFEKAFINVSRVYVDEETKKIAFAFWL